jgi:energy-coupling factor transporter ATP-binding protein EcfA2
MLAVQSLTTGLIGYGIGAGVASVVLRFFVRLGKVGVYTPWQLPVGVLGPILLNQRVFGDSGDHPRDPGPSRRSCFVEPMTTKDSPSSRAAIAVRRLEQVLRRGRRPHPRAQGRRLLRLRRGDDVPRRSVRLRKDHAALDRRGHPWRRCGEIEVLGRSLPGLSRAEVTAFRARHVGFVFQQFNLIPTLTVVENVAAPLLIRGAPMRIALARAQESLARVGIPEKARELPGRLSGGQQQRVAIARPSCMSPA